MRMLPVLYPGDRGPGLDGDVRLIEEVVLHVHGDLLALRPSRRREDENPHKGQRDQTRNHPLRAFHTDSSYSLDRPAVRSRPPFPCPGPESYVRWLVPRAFPPRAAHRTQ